jgi:hypothetical protein
LPWLADTSIASLWVNMTHVVFAILALNMRHNGA